MKINFPARFVAPGIILTALTALMVVGGEKAKADAPGRRVQKKIPLIKFLRDPHRPGNTFETDVASANETTHGNLTTQFLYSHAWDADFNTSVSLPITWIDSHTGPKVARVPRLGGGTYNRILVDADSRLAGDALSYLDLDFGVGLPCQTDSVEASSVSASWLIGGTLTGQLDFGSWAFALGFSDFAAFPKSVDNASGKEDFHDEANFLFGRASLIYFPTNRWDVHAAYVESPPFRTEVGTDTAAASYLLSGSYSERSRTVGAGFEIALDLRTLFGLDETYQLAGTDVTHHTQTWSGRVRWVF